MEVKQQGQDHELPVTVPLLLNHYETNDKEFCGIVEKAAEVEPLNFTGTTSFFNTTFNCLNALSGAGILSIPYALSSGGWFSLILLFVFASVTFYTGLLIKRCMEVDPNIRSYPDVGNKAFGKKGRTLVSFSVNLELYLVATGFLILAGDNLHNLLPDVKIDIYGIIDIGGQQSFVLLVALIMIPTVWINNMTTLSYVSATGVVAPVVVLGAVLWTGLSDNIGFREKGVLVNWSGLPTALSLYAFCYCAHPVFPTLYSSMRSPTRFSTVLLLCFVFCTVTYASMAIFGYLMFGSEVQSQITLNLPTDKFSSKVAIYTALINPIAKYALMLRPVVDAIEDHFQLRTCYSLILRTTLDSSSVIVALILPFFGYLTSLVGAFLSVTTEILFPCFCYLKISGAYRKIGLELVTIGFIVLMGLIVLVIGTYTSLLQIIQNL